MLIKVKNSQNLFLREEEIICSIKNIEQIDNDIVYHYKFFVPASVVLLKNKKANHISSYLSNKNVSSIKLQPKIGVSIFEKKFNTTSSKITRTSESRFFKIGQLAKQSTNNKKNILFLKNTTILELIGNIDVNEKYSYNKKEKYSSKSRESAPTFSNIPIDKQYFLSKKISNTIKNNIIKTKNNSRINQSILPAEGKKTLAYIPINVSFKESDINRLNIDRENLNLIFVIKRKNKLQIDSTSFTINHSKKIYDFKKRKLIKSFKVSHSKHTITAFVDNPFDLDVSFKIYAKNYNRLAICNSNFSEIATTRLTENKASVIDLSRIKNKNLDMRGTNYFRVCIQIDGIVYQDFKKEIVVKSKNHKSIHEVITCFTSLNNIRGRSSSGGYAIQTVFYNIPVDAHSIEVFKRRRSGNAKSKFVSKGVFLIPDQVENQLSSKDFSYIDKDIEDSFTYDYKIKIFFMCRDPIDVNKLASYEYNEPKEIVKISKEQQTKKSIKFKVDFKVNDVETLFKNLLRNDFELYKDQLIDVSALNGTIVKVKVEKYNLNNGSYSRVGNYSLDSNNTFEVPVNANTEKSHIMILHPSITTVSQEVSRVKKALLNQDISPTSQNIFAKNILTQKKSKSKERSFTGKKFSTESFIKKGLIEPVNKLSRLEPTGDVHTFDVLNNTAGLQQNLKKTVIRNYNISSGKVFFKSQNLRYDHVIEVKFKGNFNKKADKIVFYYLDENIEIPISIGHVDHLKNNNTYFLEYSNLYKDNVLTYILYDSFDQILDYQVLG